jgi:D-serine deaminase-like pyridoxal phosphate-dependent protein
MNIADIPTPAVLIESSKLARNIARMQKAVSEHGKSLRPHGKTHKSPVIARMQLAAGAAGICCAKLGEAEVFADAGVTDIRLPYPLNPATADRVFALANRVTLSFIVDDQRVAREWSRLAVQRGRTLNVLVKVDVGFHRCGIDPNDRHAAAIVADVASLPGLRFLGLLSHAGHGYGAASADEAKAIADEEARKLRDLAAASRVPCAEISVGATPTARFSVALDGITEMRPGNYAFFDRTQVALGAAGWNDCALTVLARVVSRPAADRVILDSGSKTLTKDLARGFVDMPGYGAVLTDLHTPTPDGRLEIVNLSEEHATVKAAGGDRGIATGTLVRIVPNHSCVVTNMVDAVWMVDGERVVERLPVAARGRIT